MNKFIYEVNYPNLPEELIPHELFDNSYHMYDNKYNNYNSLELFRAPEAINSWIKCNISDNLPVLPIILIFKTDSVIHKDNYYDPQNNTKIYRDIVINYIINPGGSNVLTTVYDDDKQVLEQIETKKYHWYKLHTNMNHSVNGITNRRIVLSISLKVRKEYYPNNEKTELLLSGVK